MTHWAKVVADSISEQGVRLTTIEVQFPRIVLAEFNTHRMLSRNSASSRAIPVKRMIAMVQDDPYIPTEWGANQAGMQAASTISLENARTAEYHWLRARDEAVRHAEQLLDLGVHKQLANRLLEPFMWHTVIVTATEWSNFFNLRRHQDAHPEIRKAADCMFEVMKLTTPVVVGPKEWHLPYVTQADLFDPRILFGIGSELGEHVELAQATEHSPPREIAFRNLLHRKISTARCARVSFLTHDGERSLDKDVTLHDRMLERGHMSPFEHAARPATESDNVLAVNEWYPSCRDPELLFFGNFKGWVQYRKLIANESDILKPATP